MFIEQIFIYIMITIFCFHNLFKPIGSRALRETMNIYTKYLVNSLVVQLRVCWRVSVPTNSIDLLKSTLPTCRKITLNTPFDIIITTITILIMMSLNPDALWDFSSDSESWVSSPLMNRQSIFFFLVFMLTQYGLTDEYICPKWGDFRWGVKANDEKNNINKINKKWQCN